MLLLILNIITPVFGVIATGYIAAYRGYFKGNMIDGIRSFPFRPRPSL